MIRFKPSMVALLALLALAACKNPDTYGGDGGTRDDSLLTAGDEIMTAPLGSAADPRSVAYFNESIGDHVLFAVNQSSLSPAARVVLDGQARWLLSNPSYTVIVEGHTDERGTREYNLALGARRAEAVKAYLVSRGLVSNRIRTLSYGKERPVEVCSEEFCYALNRRAVTLLLADTPLNGF